METIFILNSPVRTIRNLTSAECKNLRLEGVSCSPAWAVSPDGSESHSGGYLYRPSPHGGHDNTGIYTRLS